MYKRTFIFFYLLLSFSILKANIMNCGEEQINNCKECGKEEESNSCAICELKHFPLLENLFCIPCDDKIYGQVGCEGECDSSDYSNSGYAYCQACKEGYYNLDGLCQECGRSSPGCIKCTNEKETSSEKKVFKCQKCLNEEEYIIDENFQCIKCNGKLANCKKCHYEKIGEILQPQCDECLAGYYLNSDKNCSKCHIEYSTDKQCVICSSELKPDSCWCYSGYVLDGFSCIQCPKSCSKCEYNSETGATKCLRCYSGYILNSENECERCEEGCNYCYKDNSNNQICLECQSKKFLPGSNKCLICPKRCLECDYDNDKKESICIKCSERYSYDSKNNQCEYCSNINRNMQGCSTCRYNSINEKYECLTCKNDYAFIKNIYQCLANTNPEKIGLYGCLKAEYIESSNTYKCLECKNYNFILVTTDNSCIETLSVGLSNNCLEAEKLGDSYSCTKCKENYTIVHDISTNIKTCNERLDALSYCLEGKLNDGKFICTKCVDNSDLIENICSCNSYSFSKDTKLCYKCNDSELGNPGCDESEGCEYLPSNVNSFKCKKCKDGYFRYTEGKCILCSKKISNCGKCHYNITSEKVICDECINSIYVVNAEGDRCELNDCEEYPEISPGCIICKDKLEEYKENQKCQRCKHGYFKTKAEKCVYCSSEQYGGPGCYYCDYDTNELGNEIDSIICKGCYPSYSYFNSNGYDYDHRILFSEGKCYDCSIGCSQCNFLKNENGIRSLKCTACYIGYYLTPEGNCISFLYHINKVKNCKMYVFDLGYIKYESDIDGTNDRYTVNNNFNLSYYNIIASEYFSSGAKEFSKCSSCETGYFLNEDNCEKFNFDNCSFNAIIKNYNNLQKACSDYCKDSDKVKIRILLKGKTERDKVELYIDNFYYGNFDKFIDNFGENNLIKACLNNSGEGGEHAPANLKYCKEAYYFQDNNTYSCFRCLNTYILDNITNSCVNKKDDSCNIKNLGTEIMPLYDCVEWSKRGRNFVLVTNENGEKEYIEDKINLVGCVEAVANTTFINTKYNCTKCSSMYIPYFSKYFDRIICQNIKEKIIKENSISYSLYNKVKDKVNATNGICEKNYLFTPDGNYCYKCSDKLVGMLGCKGGCNFSLKRNNALKCEGGCKIGYIESSEGICSSCNGINKGCHECHYDNEYPIDYNGTKRLRRFVCDYCEEGYIQSLSGECIDCIDLGLLGCNKCEEDPNNKGKYICTKCIDDYFINDEGQCETCEDYSHFKGINKNKCIKCDNALEGGIDNCDNCESNGEKVFCIQCSKGYILLTNNNTCLAFLNNKELQNFEKCEELMMENNKLICTRCNSQYSLIKRNNINECIYIPTLYDIRLSFNHINHFYTINKGEVTLNDYALFLLGDYIIKRYSKYFPCHEAENIGTEDNPLYSCKKCLIEESKESLKIIEESSKVSFCYYSASVGLPYCKEATYKIKNGEEVYNCTECHKNYDLVFSIVTDTYYCKSTIKTNRCLVFYCKRCSPEDGYTCHECLPDYVIDSLTGYCVKKTEVIPVIIWKDIYRLKISGRKMINNRYIFGPFFVMRGITSSQINARHTFLVYVTFVKKNRIRNLEDELIKIPTICEVIEGVDETYDDANMVEYECIGNQTSDLNLTNYKLDNIEEGNNENSLKKTNLNNLIIEIKKEFGDLEILNSTESSFTYEDLIKIIIFQMNENIKDIKATNYKFNFKIEGKLSKEIAQIELKKEFELSEVDTKANCIFTIGLEKNADLSCELNVQNHKDIKIFSFKTSQINIDNNEIYLAKLNDIKLINSEKNNKKAIIIIVSVVCGIILAVLLGVGIYFMGKKLKSNNEKPVKKMFDNNKKKNMMKPDNITVDEVSSGVKINNFEEK